MEYDCIILGSGVAGLTAALYLGRANKKVLVLENNTIGGMTSEIDNIENYPGISSISGKEFVSNLVVQVLKYGINTNKIAKVINANTAKNKNKCTGPTFS